MKKRITLKIINDLSPCYDPQDIGLTEKMELSIPEFIDKFRNKVKEKEDIIWVLCRKKFMTDKDQRLFAVWCAKEALKLQESPDPQSVDACDVAERFANGEATVDELGAARGAARSAARSATWSAASAARSAARDAAESAAWSAAGSAASAAGSAAWSAASAAGSAAGSAARSAAWSAASAARDAARDAQINKLLTYFSE